MRLAIFLLLFLLQVKGGLFLLLHHDLFSWDDARCFCFSDHFRVRRSPSKKCYFQLFVPKRDKSGEETIQV